MFEVIRIKMMEIRFLEKEYWYPCVVNDGYKFPLGERDEYYFDFSTNDTFNQVNPLILSSKGRCLYVDRCKVTITKGKIIIDGVFELLEGHKNLKGAFQAARDKYFPVQKVVDKDFMFKQIQYCTWMAMKKNQNEKGVLKYAEKIRQSGMPEGLFIIDDSWQQEFGDWDFCERFTNPKAMMDELHSMGFAVSLWIVPYVSKVAKNFNLLKEKNFLVKNKAGEIVFVDTFLGNLALIDLFNERAKNWFIDVLDGLKTKYGVDGFKFDGGDEKDVRFEDFDGVGYNEIWNTFYLCKYMEYRSSYKSAGLPLIQRLADKAHIWDVRLFKDKSIQEEPFLRYGLSSVIPNTLIQGLAGYYYGCPDMVGGGLSLDLGEDTQYDEELVIRSAQTEVLLPYVQFSLPFWEQNDRLRQSFLALLNKREKYQELINKSFESALENGEPIIRYLSYDYPDEGIERITDQFLLGDKLLVAPIYLKGKTSRQVYLPKGEWMSDDGAGGTYIGGKYYNIDSGKDNFPVFIKIHKDRGEK